MAANLSSGNNQRYEAPGLNIFKGLRPDIVAIQEFNYSSASGQGINTTAAIREMIDNTFGTNFYYFRETGFNIPNGIISRWPLIASGSWTSDVGDRGYAWARIDVPGTNDLYVVSVHLKASSGSASQRASEATVLKANIQANFPTNAWLIIAGDMNLYSDSEAAITTLKTIASDQPVPVDQGGGTNTNAGRSSRYDRVLISFSLTNNLLPVTVGSQVFSNGLVFDSRVYSPLTDVSPVISTDSGATGMQHMGVVKDFSIAISVTNVVVVPPTLLSMSAANVLRWTGASNLTYSVQTKTNLLTTNWLTLGTVSSATTNFFYTNVNLGIGQRFYRISYP